MSLYFEVESTAFERWIIAVPDESESNGVYLACSNEN
jgi:hypothetical protein